MSEFFAVLGGCDIGDNLGLVMGSIRVSDGNLLSRGDPAAKVERSRLAWSQCTCRVLVC